MVVAVPWSPSAAWRGIGSRSLEAIRGSGVLIGGRAAARQGIVRRPSVGCSQLRGTQLLPSRQQAN
eukprot:1284786-Alexandrium_andersonii.AAC.1